MKPISEKNREVISSLPDSFYAGKIPSVRNKWYISAAVAAVLLPLLVAGGVSLGKKRADKALGAAFVTYHVDKGVKGLVDLQDGTRVNLNSGSRLKVLGSRRVFLDGEGWFDVKSDKENPFYVETPSGISVKVTGTQFNLSSYSKEDFKVLLVKGNIELRNAQGATRTVLPQEQLTVKSGKSKSQKTDEKDIRNATAWKEGILVFEDKPLSEAIPMMERWYGVHFNIVSPELLKERLTGQFDTETIQEVMSVLSLTHRFFYNIDGKDVTIALGK